MSSLAVEKSAVTNALVRRLCAPKQGKEDAYAPVAICVDYLFSTTFSSLEAFKTYWQSSHELDIPAYQSLIIRGIDLNQTDITALGATRITLQSKSLEYRKNTTPAALYFDTDVRYVLIARPSLHPTRLIQRNHEFVRSTSPRHLSLGTSASAPDLTRSRQLFDKRRDLKSFDPTRPLIRSPSKKSNFTSEDSLIAFKHLKSWEERHVASSRKAMPYTPLVYIREHGICFVSGEEFAEQLARVDKFEVPKGNSLVVHNVQINPGTVVTDKEGKSNPDDTIHEALKSLGFTISPGTAPVSIHLNKDKKRFTLRSKDGFSLIRISGSKTI